MRIFVVLLYPKLLQSIEVLASLMSSENTLGSEAFFLGTS